VRYEKKFGAFQDWKVLLCVEESKAGSFTRMLEAGGAKVLGSTPPFQNVAHVTHAFISKFNIQGNFEDNILSRFSQVRLEQLRKMQVRHEYDSCQRAYLLRRPFFRANLRAVQSCGPPAEEVARGPVIAFFANVPG
jgi:hypothetical protein